MKRDIYSSIIHLSIANSLLLISASALADVMLHADGVTKTTSDTSYTHSYVNPIGDYSAYFALSAVNGGQIFANNVNVTANGNLAGGILASGGSFFYFDGGSITTDGINANTSPVFLNAGSSATIKNANITSYKSAWTVASESADTIRLENSSVHAKGNDSKGIFISCQTGPCSTSDTKLHLNSVLITAQGTNSYGILSEVGSRIWANDLNIVTTNNDSQGIMTTGKGSILDMDGVSISTSCTTLCYGAFIGKNEQLKLRNFNINLNVDNTQLPATNYIPTAYLMSGSSLDMENSSISTKGNSAWGLSISNGSSVNMRNVDLTTSGIYGLGMYFLAQVSADARNVNIDTTGDLSTALKASTFSKVDFQQANIKTAGSGSDAVFVENNSDINISSSTISTIGNDSHGLKIFGLYSGLDGGSISLSNSSLLTSGLNSSAIFSNVAYGNDANYKINDTALRSERAAAIQANGDGHLDVALKNSVIESGIEKLFITSSSAGTSSLSADNSRLKGNISVSSPSFDADFYLTNNSLWKGTGDGIDTMSLKNSLWLMTGDSNVRNLVLNGSDVSFDHANGIFKTLTTNTLNGNGRFLMNTDIAGLKGDLLVVKAADMASGTHQLVIADSGKEPANGNDRLMVVDTNGGDAKFDLYGDHVDAGVYQYGLLKDGNDWFLARSGGGSPKTLSNGANAAVAAQSAGAYLWRAQMDTLLKRLGELRLGENGDGNGDGAWVRGISKQFNFSENSSRAFTQNISGIEFGLDKAIQLDKAKVYLGVMAGNANTKLNYGDNVSGKTDSTMFGGYATYLADNGYYIDAVLKYSQFHNNIKYANNIGTPVKSSYKTPSIGESIEFGKRIKLENDWFIEPQFQVTTSHIQGGQYTNSNGLQVKANDVNYFDTRVGSIFGRSLTLDSGMKAQPYVKASYIDEHSDSSQVIVNGVKLNSNLPGDRLEVGLGGILQINEKSKVSLDIEYSKGKYVEEPLGLTVGYRYLW